MLHKSKSTFVALILTFVLGLSGALAAVVPASAASAPATATAKTTDADSGNPFGLSDEIVAALAAAGITDFSQIRFGVAVYLYKKLDPTRSAGWDNSGVQQLLIQDVGNESPETNPWFTSIDPALLPADVCGDGWAVQHDRVAYVDPAFSFPPTIRPYIDTLGPGLYDSRHRELSTLVAVPPCSDIPTAPTLTGSISAVCRNDVPWISYSATLHDPDGTIPPSPATLTLSKGTDSHTFTPALGTMSDGVTLSGEVLWPGATIDGDGNATGWPGWSDAGGVWHAVDGNFAWTRTGATATISVNPSIAMALEYPTDPSCSPPFAEVTPTLTRTPASCDVRSGGTFTLPALAGLVWRVDGVVTAPGTYPGGTPATRVVTAELADPAGRVRFADRVQTSWTLTFAAPPECLNLSGSFATGECLNDSPWIHFEVSLSDPYRQATGNQAELIMTDGTHREVIPLGTILAGTPLTGDVLWPGAAVDPVTGEATDWPGWELVDGEWQTTTDPAQFGWTRAITTATLNVNPELQVNLSYPPATPTCETDPPDDPPTLGVFPTNAELDEQCTTDGQAVLHLGQVEGVSFFEDVNYYIDGVPATSSTVYLGPGTYQVTVTTKDPADGLDGPTAWTVVVTGSEACGELTTLALSGIDAGLLLALAGILVAIGAAAVITTRVRVRRPY